MDSDRMEAYEALDNGQNEMIRFSNSPRRSPHITQGHESPVRSLHPQLQQANSSHSHRDPGLRTLDFFEISSEDEENSPVDPAETAPDLERRGSATKKKMNNTPAPAISSLASQCESRSVKLSPTCDGYQPLSPTVWADAPDRVSGRDRSPSTSFNGSVDELLPSNLNSSPPQVYRSSRLSSGRTPRSSAHIPRSDDRKFQRSDERQARHSDDRQSSLPPRPATALGAYQIAHEITLNALLREGDTLNGSSQGLPLAPLHALERRSMLPAALSLKDDPRSPKVIDFSSPQSVRTTEAKKVQVVPPPIDISEAGQRSLPADLIRTPYPFSPDHPHRKDFGAGQPPHHKPEPQAASSGESVLTLSIRPTHANSKPRTSAITIPATNDFSTVRQSGIPGQKEQQFKALDFDDAEMFRQIRAAYRGLSGGPWRLLSARSLSRIVVVSPRQRSDDTTSEDKVLRHFRRPAIGKGKYDFVHWAHGLAASRQHPALRNEPIGSDAGHEGDLECIVSWSALRIAAVLLLVLTLSAASALLWTLLGKSSTPGLPPEDGSHAGFRGAGDRVASGVLMGICVLLLGLCSMAGWLGVSWLVI